MRTNSKLLKRVFKSWPLYTMLIPGMIYLIINNYLPMFGILIAFNKVDYSVGILNSPWTGFSNFTYLFASNDAFIMFRNTILYNVAFIILGNLLGLVVAIALDTVKNRYFRNSAQVIILIPHLLSTIIITYIVYAFLNEQNGFLNNSVLGLFQMDPVSWYNTPGPWPIILTMVYLWISIGYTSILYYSTLIGIDKTYYEAAVVDGASLWQQIFRITIPCMKKTIIILLILAVGRICYSDFGLFYQVPMHSGLLYPTTQTIDTFVYITSNVANEIIDAAKIDGAGEYRSLLSVVIPLCKPIIGTIALMSFIAYWNNWTNGIYYIQNRTDLYGIQNYLKSVLDSVNVLQSQISGQVGIDVKDLPSMGIRMALAVIGVLPVLIIYPFFQKSFIKGITIGSVKG